MAGRGGGGAAAACGLLLLTNALTLLALTRLNIKYNQLQHDCQSQMRDQAVVIGKAMVRVKGRATGAWRAVVDFTMQEEAQIAESSI